MTMDYGNYNNIESSSGGLDEFGSLPHDSVVVPQFLNPSSSTHFNSPPTFFEPSSNRSIIGVHGHGQVPIPSSSSMQPRPPVDDISDVVTKNPKKRTRASRKAPTTVLTTDTTNFRAMVQEFTGIPAPPFSTTSSTISPRLDPFGSGSLGILSGHLEALRSSANNRVQPASTQLLNNTSIPSVEASNVLNLQNQMVQPLSQGTSVSASTTASLDEFGLSHHFNGNWRGGVRFKDGDEDHLRLFDEIYGNGHNIQ